MKTRDDKPEYFASISDLVTTVHEMDKKVTKLYEVVTGDKEVGTDGLISQLKDVKNRVTNLEKYRWKLAGIFIGAGFVFAYLWELTHNFITAK